MNHATRTFALVGSIALVAALGACAEGSSQTGSSTSASGGGDDASGGAGGDGGDGGASSTTSSSTKASSSAVTTSTGSGDGGAGGAGGGGTGCGNNVCDAGETCASCPNDCLQNCGPTCGDDSCNGDETCQTCPDDCNACTGVCGDAMCEPGEEQSCPQDCSSGSGGGAGCPPDACSAGGSVDMSTCMNDCAAYACIIDEACCVGEWTQSCADISAAAFSFGFCGGC